jgi:2-oxoglutarate dehydrogenase E2 component (dihydrolipoamide succinyltransferase)
VSGEIMVPKLNSNDTEYTLVEWLIADGSEVHAGDMIATVETSKAIEDVPTTATGFLHQVVAAGETCAPGEIIGRVQASTMAPEPVHKPETMAGPVITEPARELINRLGIDEERINTLGRKVIRRSDVERMANSHELRELSTVQRAVGRTVTTAHQTIPAAYTVIKADVSAVVAEARELTRSLRKLVGLPDFLIAAVAGAHADFPMPFSTLVDDSTVRLAAAPNIGVTMDLGQGLYVPVIKDAAQMDIAEITEHLTTFRRHAQHATFRADDLTDANITITLHHDPGVVLAIPIIHPGQSCALALGAPTQELALDNEGTVVTRTYATIGLAYDHRVLNGRDAVLFLQALKESLER